MSQQVDMLPYVQRSAARLGRLIEQDAPKIILFMEMQMLTERMQWLARDFTPEDYELWEEVRQMRRADVAEMN